MIKRCNKCSLYWPIEDFYRHKEMLDGYLNICKHCTKIRVKNHRKENIEKVKEYDKKRANLQHRVEARRKYSKSDQGKMARHRANSKYRSQNPKKYKAHSMVSWALRNGELVKKNCEVCGSKKTEAHHDNYNKPLEVRWLCDRHHKEWHRNNRAIC